MLIFANWKLQTATIMANKRSLKRFINYVCNELWIETVAASLYGKEQRKDTADALSDSIVKFRNHYISRVSHPEPGMKKRDYYADLVKKFGAEAEEYIDQINDL